MLSYSVTKVLGRWGCFDKIPKAIMEQAIERGNDTHRCCTLYAQGQMAIPRVAGVEPRLEQFKKWWALHELELLLVEPHWVDEVNGFHGHPDLICLYHKHEIWVIDMKTPLIEAPTWKGQLSAYVRLAKINFPGKSIVGGSLQLLDDGKEEAKMTWYKEQARDFAVFLGALQAEREYNAKGGVQFD